MSHIVFLLVLVAFGIANARNISPTFPSLGGRIVGGENTTIEEHPYQVSLQLVNNHYCGGSLLRPDIVLTAAHCMNYVPEYYSVRAGTTIKETSGQVAKVLKVYDHPKYDGRDYDVSILKLDRPFELNAAVQLIALQGMEVEVPEKTMATVTGWGALGYMGEYPKNLQRVEVPKVDRTICAQQYYPEVIITERMTCYGYSEGKKDSCSGDSGGPLVANGKQVGIVSFGYKCAAPHKAGVYARVASKEIHGHITSVLKNWE